jgi:hypothetical protein
MFICDKCLNEGFEEAPSLFKSKGKCEICGVKKICNSIKSSKLTPKKKSVVIRPGSNYMEQRLMEKAHLLISCIEDEFALDTKHFDLSGRLLTNVKEVIVALQRDGRIELEPTQDRVQYFEEIMAKYGVGSM